ncbi:MAG TPA: DPP IV N-terminal domain-containing protein, partial [Saprospiraceae bacterium]|nr:DPP IV N-terminal domain-containing protein [Saprospiraceae bacterium]
MKRIIFSVWMLIFIAATAAAQAPITLEQIWQGGTLNARSLPGFNFLKDGRHYTRLEKGKINQYDIRTGEVVATILDVSALSASAGYTGTIDSYTFSEDEQKILITTETEYIYRHSTRSKVSVYDRATKQLTPVFSQKKVMYPEFNPQGTAGAFVTANNL